MAIGEREEKSDLGEDVYRVGSYLHTTAKLLLSSVDKDKQYVPNYPLFGRIECYKYLSLLSSIVRTLIIK